MRYASLFLSLSLLSCSTNDARKPIDSAAQSGSPSDQEGSATGKGTETGIKTGGKASMDPADPWGPDVTVEGEGEDDPPIGAPVDMSNETDGGMAQGTDNGGSDGAAPAEVEAEAEASFVIDPDTLSFPVVFHLGGSELWKSEESLKPVIAEVQRILAQARIEIIPQYSEDPAATRLMDVAFVPSVPDNPGVNGISFGGAAFEIFVKDKVGLRQVADERPTEAPAVRTLKDVKPGDKIAVSAAEARQARTTAHEICHQLGLPHRQDNTNLLASGTTGWTLNEGEITTVRRTATNRFAAKFMAELE